MKLITTALNTAFHCVVFWVAIFVAIDYRIITGIFILSLWLAFVAAEGLIRAQNELIAAQNELLDFYRSIVEPK